MATVAPSPPRRGRGCQGGGERDRGRGVSGLAYQKLIRDRRCRDDSDVDLFGRWWESIDCSLSRATTRKIDVPTATTIIESYEWLGTMPAIVLECYGIYFDGHLGGAVVYSPEYAENLGVWDKYDFTGKIICLSRGACAHWTPTGTASKLIRSSMKMLDRKYEVVTCTVDAEAGEIGTIYQACGFDYVGQMSAGGRRVSYRGHDGERRSGRQAQRSFGSRGRGISLLGAEDVQLHERKGRYFGFIGFQNIQRRNRLKIADLIKPYPKRDLTGSGERG